MIISMDQMAIHMMTILGIVFVFCMPLYMLFEERRLDKEKKDKTDLKALKTQVNLIY